MSIVKTDLYQRLTPEQYGVEFEKIAEMINEIDDVDFDILINSDIPFRLIFVNSWKRPFAHFLKQSRPAQRREYIRVLQLMFMFPGQYQKN